MTKELAPGIIELKKNNNSVEAMLEVLNDIKIKIENKELECFIFAAFDSGNEIRVAKGNIDNITEEQTLVSALQTMVMIDVLGGNNEDS